MNRLTKYKTIHKTTRVFFLFFAVAFMGIGGFAQTLEDYLQLAAENHPGLKASYAEIEAALQKVPQAKALPDPTLSASAFGYMEEASFSLMQNFPWFGTLGAKEKASILSAEAKLQKHIDQKNRLFLELSRQYYDLYVLEKSIGFQEENMKILKDYKELGLSKVESGNASLADVLRTEINIDEAHTAIEVLKMQKNAQTLSFNALLNRNRSLVINIPDSLPIGAVEIIPKQDSVFSEHPRVGEMEKMLAVSEAKEEVARKNAMPGFGVGINYMIIEKGTMMRPSGRDVVMPMLSVSLPIFRGKYKAARKETEFMQESYRQRIIEEKNALSSEYSTAVFRMKKAWKMLKLYQKQVQTTQKVLNLTLSGYENAGLDFEKILEIKQELLKYQLAMAKAEGDYLKAKAQIDYITKNTSKYEIKNKN